MKMFVNDVHKKEEIKTIALHHLRKYGIKFRCKNFRQATQVLKSKKLFSVPLQHLENQTITLKNGQQLLIPKRLYEMCSYILSHVEVEGIFRKEGSKSRQNEIKLSLDRGCMLGIDHHVIDVAVILKCFLRQLPEPLIPYSFHELFLRCSIIENKIEALLLACLLIPTEHLNVLCYLMQFLNEVTTYSKFNKMNSYNLAVVLAPNIFPVNEKVVPKNKLMLKKTCDVIKLMIDNSNNIGLIPDYIIEQIASPKGRELQTLAKTKRRRSGSLTRIFNGLRKIVGNKVDEDNFSVHTVTPDLLLTPASNLNKKREGRERGHAILKINNIQSKKGSPQKRPILERRWSAITSAASLKKKKRESLIYQPNENTLNNSKVDYVRVSKIEYEDIKSRVSAIEKKLSVELDNVHSSNIIHNELNIIHDIQSAYEQTLEHSEHLSPGTDQLARRLSKELRIRNSDQKMIRSPSARKIGNIRRRSREMEKPAVTIIRNSSLQKLPNGLNANVNVLARSISSPIRNVCHDANLFGKPLQLQSNVVISLNTPTPNMTSFQFNTNMECRPSSFDNTPVRLESESNSFRGRSKERRALKRNSSSTPPRYHLKQRYCDLDGHCYLQVTGSHNIDKENGVVTPEVFTPVPYIKRPLARTPRLCVTPKSNKRVHTPLRVLPNSNFNVADF